MREASIGNPSRQDPSFALRQEYLDAVVVVGQEIKAVCPKNLDFATH